MKREGKEIELLSTGLFEKSFMDSKVKSRAVSMKEKVLGHMIGPLGMIFIVNTIAALIETFALKQMSVFQETDPVLYASMGATYSNIAAITKVLSTLMGLVTGWLMQHTKSRQGRMRPWHLICGLITMVCGFCLFFIPIEPTNMGYWVYLYAFFVIYNVFGLAFYYLFNNNIVSLSTRNFSERTAIQFFRKIGWTLISGTVIGMLINSVLLPYWLENDIRAFWYLICILTIISIPLLFVEYFYTRERVIEDIKESDGENIGNIPLKEQFKALFSNKYYVLLFVASTVGQVVDIFKGGNVQYWYLRYVLDGANNTGIFLIYQVLTGIPLGLGVLFIFQLAKKYGIRNISFVGYLLVAVSCIMGLMAPTNETVAFIAGFIRQLGYVPNGYILATLICSAFDSVEHRSGFRLEGLLSVSILAACQNLLVAPFSGIYERLLTSLGFNANALVQPQEVLSFLGMAFYIFDFVLAITWLLVLPFIDLEKQLPKINADLLERKKQKVLARGEEWISPEELERQEREEQLLEVEENRIADLKEKCRRKGLDFEIENQKYLAKINGKKKK